MIPILYRIPVMLGSDPHEIYVAADHIVTLQRGLDLNSTWLHTTTTKMPWVVPMTMDGLLDLLQSQHNRGTWGEY